MGTCPYCRWCLSSPSSAENPGKAQVPLGLGRVVVLVRAAAVSQVGSVVRELI